MVRNVKRGIIELLACLFTSLFAFPFVSAVDLETPAKEAIDYFQQFFGPFFEVLIGDYQGSEFFFVKVLIMILLFIIIYSIIKKVPTFKSNSAVCFIISLIVSIFAVRYISETQLIKGILLPYGTLGVVLVTGLPFLIFFWFVSSSEMTSIGRKISWAFFGIIFALLWWSRRPGLSDVANNIYLATLIGIIAVISFDKQISHYFRLWELKKLEKGVSDKVVLELLDDLEKAERHSDTPIGKQQIKRIRNRLHELGVKNI